MKRTRRRIWRLIQANVYDFILLIQESWIVLAGFSIVTIIGTLYIWLLYDPCRYDPDPATIGCHLSFGESLYETIKLQTLQSSLAFPRDNLFGEILFFFIPLVGLALIFQGVLNFGRLLLDKGSRREIWQVALASPYRDHVIVCGLGRVGMRTVQQLIEFGFDPVVIEREWNSEFVQHALGLGVPVIIGDGREQMTLQRARIRHARALVAAINDDLLNIEIALAARAMCPNLRLTIRVFGDELDRNLERSFGRDVAFSASALAAPTYAAAIVSRDVDFVIPSDFGSLGVANITIQPESPLLSDLSDLEAKYGVRILQHQRLNHPSTAQHRSDQLTSIGTLAQLEALRLAELKQSADPHTAHAHDTVIICGLGKVGYRVVRLLYAMQPRPRIVVVRLNSGRSDFLHRIEQLDGVETIVGDARELSVLREAGLDRAFSIAALTSDDLLNLEISLVARRAHPQLHIVLRVFSDALADRLADIFKIHTAYSTSALASPTLAAAALVGGIEYGFLVGKKLYSSEWHTIKAESLLDQQSIHQIRTCYQVLVGALRQGNTGQLLPADDQILTAGDSVLLIGPIELVARLR